ncbi:MAG: hypothetical protein A2010_12365 [Nitrospirae bacterium GWD2_57_9]|nr:MAG: hypothetical protein A2010_12365 [Nitrospirae bacterium GWD2_57_9]OGW45958.1 MAG: hypothetical protein A2078_16225 [Nitrospirae bacterium GWC2_57_9]
MKSSFPSALIKKIGVLRASAVGDYIVALPALEALRACFPAAEIVLLGRHWHADFLRSRPGPIDRVVVVPYCRGIYDPPGDSVEDRDALKSFFRSMAQERFDLAFQLHGGGKNSNPFLLQLGAGATIGARTPDALPLDRWLPYRVFQNETLRLLEIVSLAGARPADIRPRLAVTGRDLDEARDVVPENGRPLAVINPGSRDHRRRWPARKFAKVADRLSCMGARIIINGDRGDAAAVEETEYWMREKAESVCGTLSLGGLAGLLTRARLLVSNDSGPLHLANALGTSAVGIYWCGNVPAYSPVSCRNTVIHISWRMHCPVCGVHCMDRDCRHRDSFVADVPVKDIAESAIDLLREAVPE